VNVRSPAVEDLTGTVGRIAVATSNAVPTVPANKVDSTTTDPANNVDPRNLTKIAALT
jgi:hypothetical protein